MSRQIACRLVASREQAAKITFVGVVQKSQDSKPNALMHDVIQRRHGSNDRSSHLPSVRYRVVGGWPYAESWWPLSWINPVVG